ncbi:MAG: hypothetical protein ACP5RI_03105 [Candidatus Micrarchaeia archaeon]
MISNINKSTIDEKVKDESTVDKIYGYIIKNKEEDPITKEEYNMLLNLDLKEQYHKINNYFVLLRLKNKGIIDENNYIPGASYYALTEIGRKLVDKIQKEINKK